eukprot:15432919-Alexandrium_andersonii.AAC.1
MRQRWQEAEGPACLDCINRVAAAAHEGRVPACLAYICPRTQKALMEGPAGQALQAHLWDIQGPAATRA